MIGNVIQLQITPVFGCSFHRITVLSGYVLWLGSLWSTAPCCCLEPRGWNRQPGPSTVQSFATLLVPGNQTFYERNNSLLANARLTDTTSKAESGLYPLENACLRTVWC